jgi:hypothetical protein
MVSIPQKQVLPRLDEAWLRTVMGDADVAEPPSIETPISHAFRAMRPDEQEDPDPEAFVSFQLDIDDLGSSELFSD